MARRWVYDNEFNMGGRPTATSHKIPLRTAAAFTPARWVPALLTLLFIPVSVRSWGALHSSLAHLSHQSPLAANISRSPSYGESQQKSSEFSAAGTLSPVFTPQVQSWSTEISRWAVEFDLDPNLIALVMQIESCGHPSVRSSAGALGLFQVMPFHFAEGEDPFDPQTNAKRGLSYLARSFDLSHGQVDLALAGYNGGHGVIDRDPSTWASETRRYVQWGMGILGDIYQGEFKSTHLDAWLAAGGANLCQRASDALKD
ncbi:MAG TPA: lytic transglycosylase domain-containing protein [Anaerolineae bacterium]|nr:lytic transglycosylase domain-containing protein [Anaerolineae bacterium]